MTKYYVDKTKEKQPVVIWINEKGQIKGVYREILDAQDDKEQSGEGGYIISMAVIKPRERKTSAFM